MGILNITPDSFSDGGKYVAIDKALAHAEAMVQEGADIIDIGGESTRPGAEPVLAEEELLRVLPVIQAIKDRFSVALSIDSYKYEVVEAAVEAGATIVNDVRGGQDIRLPKLVAEKGLSIVLMHMKETPLTMQDHPEYPSGVVVHVQRFLKERLRAFEEFGIPRERIWIDPGIGFGKTVDHNLDLLRHTAQLSALSRVLVGASRKSFLAKILGNADLPMESREAGTIASHLWAYMKGASVFRVHDVGPMKRAIRTWEAIQYGRY